MTVPCDGRGRGLYRGAVCLPEELPFGQSGRDLRQVSSPSLGMFRQGYWGAGVGGSLRWGLNQLPHHGVECHLMLKLVPCPSGGHLHVPKLLSCDLGLIQLTCAQLFKCT